MMDSDTESEVDEFSENERDKRVSDYFHPIFLWFIFYK